MSQFLIVHSEEHVFIKYNNRNYNFESYTFFVWKDTALLYIVCSIIIWEKSDWYPGTTQFPIFGSKKDNLWKLFY